MGELAFVPSRLARRGYDRRQVDAFVRRVEQTLLGVAAAPVTARELVTARFRRVLPLSLGYRCEDVDAFLFDVAPAIMRSGTSRESAGRSDAGRPSPAGRRWMRKANRSRSSH